jgi:DNA-binding transcriptional MerR regulator
VIPPDAYTGSGWDVGRQRHTLHFYDETGLLKPAYHGANGYRLYEEPQLLTLHQILFYRELGFELKQIKQILGMKVVFEPPGRVMPQCRQQGIA